MCLPVKLAPVNPLLLTRLTPFWETALPGSLCGRGRPKALVTALFEEIGDETKEQLLSLGFEPEEDGSLLLSREISSDGKTSCKIGGRPLLYPF